MHPQRQSPRERGQAIILVALMALTFVAFTGLALDGAQVYQMRRKMQNAADAAAYAGAYELASPGGVGVNSRVNEYTIVRNEAQGYTYTLTNGNACVQVTSWKDFPTLMIGVIGFSSLRASAMATACYGSPQGTGEPLWPLMLLYTSTMKVNQLVTLTTNGGYQWADFNGGSNGTGGTVEWLQNRYQGDFEVIGGNTCEGTISTVSVLIVPNCIWADPGQSNANQIRNEVCKQVLAGSSALVPLYDAYYSVGQTLKYHVIAVGKFKLDDAFLSGNKSCRDVQQPAQTPNYIQGKFEAYVGGGPLCPPGKSCGPDLGYKVISLVN